MIMENQGKVMAPVMLSMLDFRNLIMTVDALASSGGLNFKTKYWLNRSLKELHKLGSTYDGIVEEQLVIFAEKDDSGLPIKTDTGYKISEGNKPACEEAIIEALKNNVEVNLASFAIDDFSDAVCDGPINYEVLDKYLFL